MAPNVDRTQAKSRPALDAVFATHELENDVPGILADRIGTLYAEHELEDRSARTEKLIRLASELHD